MNRRAIRIPGCDVARLLFPAILGVGLSVLPAFAQSPDILVNDDTSGGAIQRAPAVAALPDGACIVAWEDSRVSDYAPNICCVRLDAQGTPVDTEWIANHDSATRRTQDYRKSSPVLAADAPGNILIAWEDYRGGTVHIRYQLAPGGHVRETTDRRPALTDFEQTMPAAAAGKSSFFLVWRHHDNEIRGVRIDSLGDPGLEFAAAEVSAPGVCLSPAVAAWYPGAGFDPGFVATWQESWPESTAVRARWFCPDGRPATPALRAGGAGATRPRVACDSLGRGLVVWKESELIWAITFEVFGSSPSHPFAVSDDRGSAVAFPAVSAALDSARFTIVWQDNRDGPSGVFAQLIDWDRMSGGNFRLESEPGPAGESTPCVAMCRQSNGAYAAFWTDLRESDANIYGVVQTAIPSPAPTFRLNNDRASCIQDFSVINLDADGNARCFWFDFRNGTEHSAVWGQRLNHDGTLAGHNFRVNDDPAGSPANFLWAATNRSGLTVVTWQDHRNGEPDIYAQLYNAECLPVGSNFRVNDDTGNAPQTWPFVSINDSGGFVVAWTDARSRVVSPYAQLFDRNGNRLGMNWRVAYSGREPSCWISPWGDFWLSWISPVGLRMRHYDSTGAPLDTALHVTEGIAADFGAPKVNGTGLGTVWLVWMDQRRGDWEVYAQKLNSDGQFVGGNFRVNDGNTVCGHYLPWIAWNGADRIYITWTDMRIPGNLDVRCLLLDTTGAARDSSFIVNTDPGPNVNQWAYGSVAARDDNVVFTWIDNRNRRSWDTYARIGLPRVPVRRWWTSLSVMPSITTGLCRIRPTLPVRGTADLAIYDVSGRRVRNYPNQFIAETGGSLVADIGDLPPGLYPIRLKVQGLTLGATVVRIR